METHGRLKVALFVEPSFGENCYLLWCDGCADCWIVDPGIPSRQTEQLVTALEKYRLRPRALLVTHCHVDHIAGLGALRERLGEVPVVCPRGEEQMLVSAEENLSAPFGVPFAGPPPDRLVAHNDVLELGDLSWRVLDVSGHSPAGVAYYCAEAGVALVGDAVFADSIGRYDFPHSSRERLLRNIREHLLTLPPETVIYAGHGPQATVGHIHRHNQVLRWELERC